MSKEQKFGLLRPASYGGANNIPAGMYALSFKVMLHAGESRDGKKKFGERLGVMVTAYPINEKGELQGEPKQQFLSAGRNAHKSFAPNPKTGMGMVPIPGGPAQGLPSNTNWHIFGMSMVNSGAPELDELDGVEGCWAHVENVPEPAERKSYAAANATSEAAETQEEFKGSGLVPVVTSFLEGGKPWENDGGGIPSGAEAPKPAGKPNGKVAEKPKAAAKAAAPASDDPEEAAMNAIGEVLSASPEGVSLIKLKTDSFKFITKANGDEIAQQCQEMIFNDKSVLADYLSKAEYKIEGLKVVPA